MFIKKNRMAEVFCRMRGWKYRILFEKDLEDVS
jgi:hypothetical protein